MTEAEAVAGGGVVARGGVLVGERGGVGRGGVRVEGEAGRGVWQLLLVRESRPGGARCHQRQGQGAHAHCGNTPGMTLARFY